MLTAAPFLGTIIGQIFFWLPLREKPVRLAALGLALAFGTFALIAAALITPVAGAHLR
jgi:uncharacterized membrane protein